MGKGREIFPLTSVLSHAGERRNEGGSSFQRGVSRKVGTGQSRIE
jgi:hypothetical protein